MPALRRPSVRRLSPHHPARGAGPRRRSHVVDCAVYVDGVRQPGPIPPEDAIELVRKTGGSAFVWIGLHEPDEAELAGLAELLDLHPLAVEDAVHAHQRPKLERYDDMLFTVLKTVRYVAAGGPGAAEIVETGEVMVFVGRDFVVTVRHGEHGGLRALRFRLEKDAGQLALGPSAVLHAIADRVVDDYLHVTRALQDDIDAMESAVFASTRSRDAEQIYLLKREVLELRRAVAPLAEPLRALADRPMRLVHPEIREYFRNVEDHLARVSEQVAGYDELLTTIVQANLAQVTVAQNEDMRKISAWVAIFAIPTMVAGIYGMNFDHMPELHWRFGYPLVLGLTFLVCTALHRGFRRNGWL
ncbi:MAG TPA: magnesium and cobalt transport protein CorA [Mycobacteriales bacterium]|nr:magnesium and cobalt transport protein CorA [Mycobacteriales bacterium]